MLTSVELFAGIGGLALGVSNAGFQHKAVIELDSDACTTIRENQRRKINPFCDWPLMQSCDVRTFDFSGVGEDIDLLAAGVPCQPWSLGGKHKGFEDERNLFPDTIAVIRRLRPKAILIENVKGLLRPSFSKYFEYIKLMVRHPEVLRKPHEQWTEHLSRLERYHTSSEKGLEYRVISELLNAANYGVPQRRERVFIVAFRSDLHVDWSFPSPTYSQDALLADQWVTGAYWDRHKVSKQNMPAPPTSIQSRIERVRSLLPLDQPWRTVRDAIDDLPDPVKFSGSVTNHIFQPGARSYPGHTGSPLDEPAKTLKAGDHGVPGGENMVRLPDGRVRYFTVRESARIQTFPDNFVFHGTWTETMRQLGNAVPVDLATMIATDIRQRLGRKAGVRLS